MPKQHIPNPEPQWDPDQTIERERVRERDPSHEDDSSDKSKRPSDRPRKPLQQPGDLSDVQADPTAGRRSNNESEERRADQDTGSSGPHSSQRPD